MNYKSLSPATLDNPGQRTVFANISTNFDLIPDSMACAYCQGTPLRNEIESRDPSRLAEATDVAAEAIARQFGPRAVDGKIQAHIVTIEN